MRTPIMLLVSFVSDMDTVSSGESVESEASDELLTLQVWPAAVLHSFNVIAPFTNVLNVGDHDRQLPTLPPVHAASVGMGGSGGGLLGVGGSGGGGGLGAAGGGDGGGESGDGG